MLVVLAPVVFTFLWMITNTQLPASDATDYLLTANRMYLHFINDGFWNGMFHLGTEKGWRPIFFPVLSVPFLLISRGSMIFAYNAVSVSIILATSIYVYLLLRLQLDRLSAVIAANLVSFLPFIYFPLFPFIGEAALFPAIIGTIYHLIASDYFRNKLHACGFIICFSLALMIRPVEAATDMSLILPVFIFFGGYQRIFSVRQIISVAGLSFFAVFLFLLSADLNLVRQLPLANIDSTGDIQKLSKLLYKLSLATLTCALLSGGILLIMNMVARFRGDNTQINQSSQRQQTFVVPVFGLVFVIVLTWFLPYAFQTLGWIFTTSFGSVAQTTLLGAPKHTIWETIYAFIYQESLMTVAVITVVAFLGLLTVQKSKIKSVISSSAFIYLPLLLPFPLWEVLNTVQSEPRKLGLAFPGLLIALLIIGLQKGKWWGLRVAIIGTLLIAQIIFAFNVINPRIPQLQQVAQYFGSYAKPITIQPNPHDVVLSFLDTQAEKHRLKKIDIVTRWDYAQPINGYLLDMYKQIANRPYIIESYPIEAFENLNSTYDAVFLADSVNDMMISKQSEKMYFDKYTNERNPATNNVYHFLYYYSKNDLNSAGWELGPCLVLKGTDEKDYRGCLLFSLKNKENLPS